MTWLQASPLRPLGRRWPLAALAALALVGLALPEWAVSQLTFALARGLVVLGLLVLWRTGLVSFGQGLFYCLGAYAVGMGGLFLGIGEALLLVPLGILVSGVVAWLVGLLVARYREIFFAMLSLAFSMILYGILVNTEELGSTDGFSVVPPAYLGFAPREHALLLTHYWMVCAVVGLAGWGVHRYLQSTMGHLSTAIRDNEIRVEYLGLSARRVIHFKYVLSGVLAGAGGALTAYNVGHVDPEMAYWTTSGEFVFVTILSGTGSIAAPFIGSVLFEVVRTYAVEYSPYTWQMILGTTLLLLILFLPDGLWSLVERWTRRRRARA